MENVLSLVDCSLANILTCVRYKKIIVYDGGIPVGTIS